MNQNARWNSKKNYCAVFYFALGPGRGNVLSDTYAAYVAIDLALYLMKEKGSPLCD